MIELAITLAFLHKPDLLTSTPKNGLDIVIRGCKFVPFIGLALLYMPIVWIGMLRDQWDNL